MESPQTLTPEPRRTFWQRKVRDPIVAQLTQGISPEKIALTIAVGTALALFPILGTTTFLCFIAALTLRLNQPLIHLINQAFFPIHVPVIFACVHLGDLIFNTGHKAFSIRKMNKLFWESPTQFFQEFGAVALHACVAWAIMAPFYIAAVYFIALPVLKSIAKARQEAALKKATPPEGA